jgi:FSR family fosmidomycin resistance protein-like MFS transporter
MKTDAHPHIQSENEQFNTGQVATIAGGHFLHDTFSAFLAPLLPLIIDKLSLTLTLAGTLTTFTQIPSLLNPFIGYAADKLSLRYFIILAPGITATLMSLIGIAPSYWALALLLFLSGISIAMFHAPAPAMIANVSGTRVGKGMSFFMASGELGRTIGPIIATAAVSFWGLEGMYRLIVFGWIASLILYLRFRSVEARPAKRSGFRAMLPMAWRLFAPLAGITLARNFLIVALGTFLPTLLNSEGASLWLAGSALAIYEGAGVVGAFSSGTMSDKLGRKPVLTAAFTASALLMFVFLNVQGWMMLPVLILLGFTALAPQPVILAIVQDHLPQHRALANGLYMAMGFLIRIFTTIAIGFLGDQVGLRTAFFWSGLIALTAIVGVMLLPNMSES